MSFSKSILIILFVFVATGVNAQKQLILLKKENVLLRLFPGDEIVFRLKGSKSVTTSYINNLTETALIAHKDTIPFQNIDRLYFKQRRFYNTIGSALVIFGTGLFLIDQINVVLVNGQSPDLDSRVSALSLGSLAAGIPMMLLKKKSQKVRYPSRLMTVSQGSAFYRPDTRGYIIGP